MDSIPESTEQTQRDEGGKNEENLPTAAVAATSSSSTVDSSPPAPMLTPSLVVVSPPPIIASSNILNNTSSSSNSGTPSTPSSAVAAAVANHTQGHTSSPPFLVGGCSSPSAPLVTHSHEPLSWPSSSTKTPSSEEEPAALQQPHHERSQSEAAVPASSSPLPPLHPGLSSAGSMQKRSTSFGGGSLTPHAHSPHHHHHVSSSADFGVAPGTPSAAARVDHSPPPPITVPHLPHSHSQPVLHDLSTPVTMTRSISSADASPVAPAEPSTPDSAASSRSDSRSISFGPAQTLDILRQQRKKQFSSFLSEFNLGDVTVIDRADVEEREKEAQRVKREAEVAAKAAEARRQADLREEEEEDEAFARKLNIHVHSQDSNNSHASAGASSDTPSPELTTASLVEQVSPSSTAALRKVVKATRRMSASPHGAATLPTIRRSPSAPQFQGENYHQTPGGSVFNFQSSPGANSSPSSCGEAMLKVFHCCCPSPLLRFICMSFYPDSDPRYRHWRAEQKLLRFSFAAFGVLLAMFIITYGVFWSQSPALNVAPALQAQLAKERHALLLKNQQTGKGSSFLQAISFGFLGGSSKASGSSYRSSPLSLLHSMKSQRVDGRGQPIPDEDEGIVDDFIDPALLYYVYAHSHGEVTQKGLLKSVPLKGSMDPGRRKTTSTHTHSTRQLSLFSSLTSATSAAVAGSAAFGTHASFGAAANPHFPPTPDRAWQLKLPEYKRPSTAHALREHQEALKKPHYYQSKSEQEAFEKQNPGLPSHVADLMHQLDKDDLNGGIPISRSSIPADLLALDSMMLNEDMPPGRKYDAAKAARDREAAEDKYRMESLELISSSDSIANRDGMQPFEGGDEETSARQRDLQKARLAELQQALIFNEVEHATKQRQAQEEKQRREIASKQTEEEREAIRQALLDEEKAKAHAERKAKRLEEKRAKKAAAAAIASSRAAKLLEVAAALGRAESEAIELDESTVVETNADGKAKPVLISPTEEWPSLDAMSELWKTQAAAAAGNNGAADKSDPNAKAASAAAASLNKVAADGKPLSKSSEIDLSQVKIVSRAEAERIQELTALQQKLEQPIELEGTNASVAGDADTTTTAAGSAAASSSKNAPPDALNSAAQPNSDDLDEFAMVNLALANFGQKKKA